MAAARDSSSPEKMYKQKMSFMIPHPLLAQPLETAALHLGNAKSVSARGGAVKIEHDANATPFFLLQGQLRIGSVVAGTCGAKHSETFRWRNNRNKRGSLIEFASQSQILPSRNPLLLLPAERFPRIGPARTKGGSGVLAREGVGGSRRRDLIARPRFKLANREFE